MYLGNADPMLQVARYKNTEDISRAAAHHISKTVATLRARDRTLSRYSHRHVPAFGRLTELLLPGRTVSQPSTARGRAGSGAPAHL